ncbi:hypothetical protein SAMN04488569_10586 [Marinilactibacillus piezotolerans]|uniref:Uncharacterized protein n=1 Tax=Marinilactibacillus piezotolerans TaxID=258723 RepID=A0A1I4B0V8_9LACT|nr:hypothetical protein [Marinilactibacillus piezotolerans]SFK61721.1 hypothetical protein SAMN04488569_10586 [Marinilactibacillus piezotolerans]
MSREIYTIEQEKEVLEETMKSLGYNLNHNYFIADRGLRPFLQAIFDHYPISVSMFLGSYSLLFAEDHLVMLNMKYLEYDDPKKYVQKIKYEEITDFFVSRPFIKYCLGFKANGKRYYFYIDANGSYSFTGLNYSDKNFQYLLEDHFKGLLKRKMLGAYSDNKKKTFVLVLTVTLLFIVIEAVFTSGVASKGHTFSRPEKLIILLSVAGFWSLLYWYFRNKKH